MTASTNSPASCASERTLKVGEEVAALRDQLLKALATGKYTRTIYLEFRAAGHLGGCSERLFYYHIGKIRRHSHRKTARRQPASVLARGGPGDFTQLASSTIQRPDFAARADSASATSALDPDWMTPAKK